METSSGEVYLWFRITPRDDANDRFAALNQKIHELAKEISRRHQAEGGLTRRNSLLQTQRELLASIAEGTELAKILGSLAATVQQHSSNGAVVSILLLENEGKRLRHAVLSDLPPAYARMVEEIGVGPQVGCCGAAAFNKQPVFVGDILDHPNWNSYREAALLSGMRACWSTPILSQDQGVLGTFAVYYRHPYPDISEDTQIIDLCINTAAVAIQKARLEQQRQETEQALRRTETLAAAGRLAATVAHEINNPLEAITNLIYLANTDPAAPESIRRLLTMADEEIARVSHIAHRTVGFYRDNSHPAVVDLSEVVDDVLLLYAPKFSSRSLRLEKQIEIGVKIWGAEGEVRQVVSNLISNAIDACDSGKCIAVRVAARSRSGVAGGLILVSDTGCGIPAEIRTRVFDPFFTTKRDVGTGLGLWVSKGITEKHGGALRFRSSVNPGWHGTVFSLFLPRDQHATNNA
jgi:signal transduction histidine kinase